MPRQYDQIETLPSTELRARLIAEGVIRPKTRPPWWIARPRLPDGEPVLELDAEGRRAAARHIEEGEGRIVVRPVLGLASILSSSRLRVVRRGRRFA